MILAVRSAVFLSLLAIAWGMSHQAAVLTEIITLIDSVSASDKVACSLIPDVFQNNEKTLLFCQAAKGLEDKCSASIDHFKKIIRNLKSLSPKNCKTEDHLPEVDPITFLASLQEFTKTHLKKAQKIL